MWRQVFNLPGNYGKLKTCRHLGTDTWDKAAGEVLGAKQSPHRSGTAPALGLRAGSDVHRLFRRPAWGIFNDCHRIWNGFAVAAAGPLNLAGVSALTPEWPP